MKFGMPPDAKGKKGRPPVRAEGQKSSKAKSIIDDGETRGPASAIKGKLAQMLGSTGKGPPPSRKPPARLAVPQGPGAGMLPGIAGPGARRPAPAPQLAIGERPELGPHQGGHAGEAPQVIGDLVTWIGGLVVLAVVVTWSVTLWRAFR